MAADCRPYPCQREVIGKQLQLDTDIEQRQ